MNESTMRGATSILLAILLATPLAAATTVVQTPSTATPAQAAFERLKALAGDWQELDEPHRRVSYRVISHGSVVHEEFHGERSMSTFYHLDGDDLFLTHYCSAGNQPRMRATNPDPGANSLSFRFVDVTNLRSPDAHFTRDLEIVFEDADHVDLTFTGQKAGRLDEGGAPVRLERISAATNDVSGLDDAFARLKSLAGHWQVVNGSSQDAQTVRYSVTGNGSAVVEQFEKGGQMASVYHRDGDAIRVTHYCNAGNQPRMRADADDWNPETGELAFAFVDVTNVSDPEDYYTRTVRLVLDDPNRLEIHFWGTGHGKEYPADLELRRISD